MLHLLETSVVKVAKSTKLDLLLDSFHTPVVKESTHGLQSDEIELLKVRVNSVDRPVRNVKLVANVAAPKHRVDERFN